MIGACLMTWLILGGLIILAVISPLFGLILLAAFVRWRFRAFFWRLRMAWFIFFLVLFFGMFASRTFSDLLGWFLK
jgi:hypothetical protein